MFSLLLEVILLIISELLFEEVIKKLVISKILIIEVIKFYGYFFNSINKVVVIFLFIVVVIFFILFNLRKRVDFLKIDIYKNVSKDGMSSMFRKNFCIVCFFDIWVINIFINGD